MYSPKQQHYRCAHACLQQAAQPVSRRACQVYYGRNYRICRIQRAHKQTEGNRSAEHPARAYGNGDVGYVQNIVLADSLRFIAAPPK